LKDNQVDDQKRILELKADELVALIKQGEIDVKHIKAVQQKINTAANSVTTNISLSNEVAAPNDLEALLSRHELNIELPQKTIDFDRIKRYVLIIIGVVMITLGMAMIIMPAPPYFEMFTIFYFNANDGVTLMDLIALIIVFTGVYLPLSTLSKKRS